MVVEGPRRLGRARAEKAGFFSEEDADAPVVRRRGARDPLEDSTPMWKQDYRGHFDKLAEEQAGVVEEESDFSKAMKARAEGGGGLGLVDVEAELASAFANTTKEETEDKGPQKKPGSVRDRLSSTALPDVFDPRTRKVRIITRDDLFGSGKGIEVGSGSGQVNFAPTKRERAAWKKNSKYAVNYVADAEELALENQLREEEIERKRLAYIAEYEVLKKEFAQVTAVAGVLAIAIVYTSVGFSKDLTASTALGVAGAILYARLLSRSADGGAPPRLAVPIILAGFWNRWETLFADDAGLHLSLLYISIGFFTYKASSVWQVIKAILPVEEPVAEEATEGTDLEAAGRAEARGAFDSLVSENQW